MRREDVAQAGWSLGRHEGDVLVPNQYIIVWKRNVAEGCKRAVYRILDNCSSKMKLGRGVGLINAFGIVASPNAFMNCIVRNHETTPKACNGHKIKALFKDCDLDVEEHTVSILVSLFFC